MTREPIPILNLPGDEDFIRLPGLFRRWELSQVVELGEVPAEGSRLSVRLVGVQQPPVLAAQQIDAPAVARRRADEKIGVAVAVVIARESEIPPEIVAVLLFALPERLAGFLIESVESGTDVVVLAKKEHVLMQDRRRPRAPLEDEERLRHVVLPDLVAGLGVKRHQPEAHEIDVDTLGVGGRGRGGVAVGLLDRIR